MIKVTEVEVKRAYINGDYRNYKFQTTLEIQVGERYNRSHYAFNEEDNAAVVDYILALARVRMTMDLMPVEPVEPITPPNEIEPDDNRAVYKAPVDEVAL